MKSNNAMRWFTPCCQFVLLLSAGCSSTPAPKAVFVGKEGETINVAPFGQVMRWEKDGRDYGVMWEDARDIFRVVVGFADPAPNAQTLRLEYWQSSWPERRIPRDRPSGSGSSGWLNVGDWYNGKWQRADAVARSEGGSLSFTFNPVNAKEFTSLKNFDVPYRSTMKLRVVSDAPLPAIRSFEAYTDSTLKGLAFEVERAKAERGARIEVFNGGLESASAPSRNVTEGRIQYAVPQGYNSFDETVVTVRGAKETFSFAASDLIRHGHIFIPDLGVLVRKAGERMTYAAAEEAWRKAKADEKTMDLYSRVAQVPEQTLTRAWNDTPAKKPQYIPLSFEGTRQHFRSDANGDVVCNKNWIARLKGKDTPLCRWEGDEIRYRFGLPTSAPVKRGLMDGCLPIIVNEWEEGGVKYRQTAFAMPLNGVPKEGQRIHADDSMVMLVRIEMERAGNADAEAKLALAVSHAKADMLARMGQDVVVAQNVGGSVRAVAKSADPASSYVVEDADGKVKYQAPLTAAEPKRTVELLIPFVTVAEEGDISRLRAQSFDESLAVVRDYWRSRIAAGTQIQTPEPMVSDFYKADVSHLLINTEREVGGDAYMAKVGTFHYGVFSNESTMMISDLDRRGYHDVAERALETFLKYQGTVKLPGDYLSQNGMFYGANGYEHGGYNQHHGWVLWCMGEHYWYTRDNKWMEHAAPEIVKACDWIIRERQRTIEEAKRTPMRAIERGLLPPGSLEDIGDWRVWLSNNNFSWWGMDNAARALAAAGHPEGKRLVAEAQAYHSDLIAAFTEAMRRSPVVRLRDGSWVPKVPSDVHRRGRSFGWITETLEGSIYLIRTGAIDPNSTLATWIVKDYEDNLYLSEQYGYKLEDAEFERRWFSHGGISQQAFLLQNPVACLLRDEAKHYIRAYFNAFAVSYFPDTRMMTEHALPNIGDWRGDHYKSSDESNSTYWLRLMFVQERGDELWLGAAVPRYWLADGQKIGITNARTYFGPMSIQMESAAAKGQIRMTLDPPKRNPPKVIRCRFRHPEAKRMVRCEVNGKAYDRFDAGKEWVELRDPAGKTEIVAYY